MSHASPKVPLVERPLRELLASLGDGAFAVDGLADPDALAAALAAGFPFALRAFPHADREASGMHAAAPPSPVWLALSGAELTLGGVPAPAARLVVTLHDATQHTRPTCRIRHVAALRLVTDGADAKTFVLAEARGASPDDAASALRPLAAALASRLGSALEGAAEADAAALAPHPGWEPPSVDELRLTLAAEGPRLVVRDLAGTTPRDGVSFPRGLALALALLALGCAAGAFAAREQTWLAVGVGTLGLLCAVGAFAFFGVASFAARFTGESVPLLSLGDGRVVPYPWVSREGALDLRPEGRLGAAIPIGEVGGVTTEPRGDAWAVSLTTLHGPIDLVSFASEAPARAWERRLASALDRMRKPGSAATAKVLAKALA
jgi:hypothetical protein